MERERYSSEIKMPAEMMSTTRKHSKIINAFVRGISGVEYNSVDIVTSDCALVYCGKRNNLDTVKLVDTDKLTNIEYFKEAEIFNKKYNYTYDMFIIRSSLNLRVGV